MKIDEYISSLRDKNIIVSFYNKQIAVNAEDGVLTPEIVSELTSKKQELLDFFGAVKKGKQFEPIPKALEQDYYPLSSAQSRMYFLYEFEKTGTSYNMPSFYRISKNLDISKLEAAYKELVRRHQSLCTVFKLVDSHPVQQVIDSSLFELTYHQCSASEVDSTIADFVRPFDLSKDFPIRVSLVDVIGQDYLLMSDVHHIINDGVSNEILMRDFWSIYNEDVLPDLGIQYIDYAVWQESNTYQELISQHKTYWLDCYRDELTTLELPTDYSRPANPSNKGKDYKLTLSKKQSDQLRSVAGSEGVTMYILFLAIYNVLLNKLSNQTDIVVGTPTVGRHHADLEGLVGMFVNTLALRNKADSNLSFRDFLANVKQNTLKAFDNQLYQYEELVDTLEIPRGTGHNPLFDVFFSYVNRIGNVDINNSLDITIEPHGVAYTSAKFDLSFEVIDADQISFIFNYRTDLFNTTSIERFSGSLLRIIDEVLENKTQLLSEINILSDSERTQLLVDFNSTSVDYDFDKTVLDMIKNQAVTRPNAEAVIFGKEILTYKELDLRSDLWASNLMTSGVVTGAVVGLMMTRSSEMIIAILAVMKAGAAYMPINIDLPGSRAVYMMEESGCSSIIANIKRKPTELESYSWISVEELDNEFNNKKKLPIVKSDSLAYILYTSGSTGRPKGCMISHVNLFNYIFWSNNYYFKNSEEGNWGLMTSMSFDLSVTAIFTSLSRGKKLYLCDEGKSVDQSLLECFTNPSLDTLKITPTHVSVLKDLDIYNTNISTVICGGEQLKKTHIKILKDLNENIRIYNEYGPTETTVGCTVAEIRMDDNKISVGSPVANTRLYILDSNQKVLPIGVVGEIYIGGKGVSKGYIGNSLLTTERFVSIDNSICYKTGDFARWLPNGTIEYLGRIDDQIKLRGYRIELGEIENRLIEYSEISSAVIINKQFNNDDCLVGYYISEGNSQIKIEELKKHLLQTLPAYMIPSYFIEIVEIPLTPNGKLDTSSLPEPEILRLASHVDPSNETEEKLLTIWSDILKVEKEKISVTTSFFNIGGNSLKTITLSNYISKIFSVEISITALFNKQTIKSIADYIITVYQLDNETENESEEKVEILL